MPSPLTSDLIDLQRNKKVASLSWQDEESGPKHEAVWTSTCKCMGTFWHDL